ncbi:hypothetical protein [Curtobacterium oceanosedimentum]|uniref:Lipoprotein n=1 Tax=Curtobacterium oceanosedimentum TaxID=465820 RepID=A0A147DNF6_9MICO|nr:hypothetical protein [Curtobacterium oceanosedimentum]KTR50951.1 hypothetical protein NS359_12550 [Curtobacterium oceanosedimentum]
MHRAHPLIPALALAALAAITLTACSSGDDDGGRPTKSASASTSASAGPTTTPPTSSSPSPTDESSTIPIPSQTPATQTTDAPPSDFPATALVTYAGWDASSSSLQAVGIVSGTTDASGTCRFTVRSGGTERSATSAAVDAASSVNCAQVSFPRSQVASGSWTVTLSYTLGGKTVTSEATTAEVP